MPARHGCLLSRWRAATRRSWGKDRTTTAATSITGSASIGEYLSIREKT
jgi:hypothetical protein